MGEQLLSSSVTIALGILGIAMIAVLVSKNAQTGSVVKSVTQGFAADLNAALSPVTGFTGGGVGSTFVQ